MSRVNLIILIIFSLLSASIVFEAGVLMGGNNDSFNKQLAQPSQQKNNDVPKPTSANLAINRSLLYQLGQMTKDVLIESIQINTIRGKIIKIDNNYWFDTRKNAINEKAIKLDLFAKTKINSVFYDNTIKVTKVYEMKNGVKKITDFKTLKVGDIISIKTTYSLIGECSKDECAKEVIIIKEN